MMVNVFSKWNIIFIFITCMILIGFPYGKVDLTVLLDLDALLQKHGYPVEIHEVTTDDGYILTIFRVPHGKNGTEVNKKPILMMHGLYGSAYNFVFNEYFNMSMAGYFADHGYDVWLGNTRGNRYGRRHVKLDPDKSKFWKFSWHEIGLHDLPATVDYILNVTDRNNLYYVGHSQGGTTFYVLASLRPEYQKKFAQVSLLAPGGLMAHYTNHYMLPLVKRHRMLYKMAENADLFELPPRWLNMSDILFKACIGTIMRNFCENTFITMNGGDSGEFDTRIFPMLVNTLPSASTMQALHYAQNIDAGSFRQWDFGKKKNLNVYGQEEPPEYPVEKIEVPVAIYYGNNDNQAFTGDQEAMCRRLKNCYKYKMPNPKWNHFDFLVSKNSEKEIFEPLMEHMEKFKLS